MNKEQSRAYESLQRALKACDRARVPTSTVREVIDEYRPRLQSIPLVGTFGNLNPCWVCELAAQSDIPIEDAVQAGITHMKDHVERSMQYLENAAAKPEEFTAQFRTLFDTYKPAPEGQFLHPLNKLSMLKRPELRDWTPPSVASLRDQGGWSADCGLSSDDLETLVMGQSPTKQQENK